MGLSLSYPFVLQNTKRLTGAAGLYASHNQDHYVVEGSSLSATLSTRLRVAHAGFDYIDATATRRRSVNLQLYQGLDVAGAGQTGNFYDLDFFRARGQASQSNTWPHHFGTVVSAAWQYSADNLPSSEQISFGGAFFGNAYPPGEVAGDSGWGASVEINREFNVHTRYLQSIRPYLSLDMTHVSLNSATLQHDSLESAAIGVRFSDKKHYSVGIGVAYPIGDIPASSNRRAPRLIFAYSYRL
jgi:hemolysin activation/secretion protein